MNSNWFGERWYRDCRLCYGIVDVYILQMIQVKTYLRFTLTRIFLVHEFTSCVHYFLIRTAEGANGQIKFRN